MKREISLALICVACAAEPTAVTRSGIEVSPEIPGLLGDTLSLNDEMAAELSNFGAKVAAPAAGALVAAPAFRVNDQRRGAVVPFSRANGVWTPEEFISPEDVADDGYFAGDGMAAHGAKAAVSDVRTGSVWLFDHVDDAWAPAAVPKLLAPDDPPAPGFGRSLALSDELLVVAANHVVYVSERDGSGWGEWQPLARDPALDDAVFGPVATFGGTVVVGVPYPLGVVYSYEREDWGSWTLIRGHEDAGATEASTFGFSLALDDEHLFVGTPDDEYMGSVHVFERAQGAWSPLPKIVSKVGPMLDGAEGDQFGHAIALALGRVFVGSPAFDPLRMRVQGFGLEPPHDEEARLLPTDGLNYFGSSLAGSSASLVVGSAYQAFAYILAPGAECSTSAQCESGHCAQGVCCETACDAGCESCRATAKASGPSGICGPVGLGTDPYDACEAADICGNTGVCDGTGQCAVTEKGTICEAATCADATRSQDARVCDGAGVCAPAATTDCNLGYTCVDAVCRQNCRKSADCASDFWCLDDVCVTGRRCSDDRRDAFDERGVRSSCDTVLCSDGRCPETCETSADCVSGFCHPDEYRCVEASALEPMASSTSSTSGCSCHMPGLHDRSTAPMGMAAFMIGLLSAMLTAARRHRELER